MRVNCWPAKRCVWPVLAPAQACVRARERRRQFGIRNRGAGDERARRSVSVVAICPRFMPGVAVLSRRFAIGARPALHLWRGGLPSARARRGGFVAAFAIGSRLLFAAWRQTGRLAISCVSVPQGRDRHLCVLAVLVRLSDIAGSLRVCAFLYGDLDGVTGDAGERGYGIRENAVRGYGS